MTGVEAVSNGVSALREPVVKTAHRTLTAIVAILGVLLAGIAYLAYAYQIGAMDQTQEGYQSVLSQLAGAVVGRGVFYYVAIGSVLCVLCLSANTSFVDFPRVCRLVAEDDFLPRPFAVVGRRLVFSVGILYLAVSAGILLVAFGGITDRLIPLIRDRRISDLHDVAGGHGGALAAGAAHGERFTRAAWRACEPGDQPDRGGYDRESPSLSSSPQSSPKGAWITMLVIPCVIILLLIVKRYYAELDAQLREDGPIKLTQLDPPIVLVTTQGWNRLTDQALQFALRLSPDVVAVHLVHLAGPDVDERKQTLRQRWAEDVEMPTKQAGLRPPQLILLDAEYRRITGPLLQLIRETERDYPNRLITVLIPEVVKDHWWQYVLHTHRARRIRAALLRYGPGLVVITIPWHLEEPRIEEGLEEQEVREAPRGNRRIAGKQS